MDAPVSAGDSSLVGSIVEGPPTQRQSTRRSNPGLNYGRSGRESNGIPKLFAAGPQRENACSCRTESAVARDIFGKRRCRNCSQLIWNPMGAIRCDCALSWTSPALNLLAMEEIWDCVLRDAQSRKPAWRPRRLCRRRKRWIRRPAGWKDP